MGPPTDPVTGSDASTLDNQLGGRVRLAQPASGYRAAIDPVLLAAFVPAKPGDLVLDAGMGAGAAALCLAMRVPDCRVIGIEIQPELARLALDNIVRNKMSGRVEVMTGSLAKPPAQLAPASFSQVMTNPPYLESGSVPPDPGKARSNLEAEIDLETWLLQCLALLKPKGILTLIHRADRLDDVLAALHGRAGDVTIFPLWPKAGRAAKRVLIRARKDSAAPATLSPGLVLHRDDGRYTDEAQSILRDAAAISI
jgi:tRNA1(Val) A37 N6-methylase TrmN6